FGELVTAATARRMRVVARMDCNYAYEEALRAHPEWFERNQDGVPRRHNESTWLFRTCMFSPYFSEQMPAIYREINERYQVAGFFTNGWPSTGALSVCYCENCQQVFRAKVGGVPPQQTDATSPLYRKYYDVYMDRVLEIWRQWQAVVTERGRASVYVGNLGGGIRTVKNVRRLGEVAAWFNADHQGRSGDTPIWDCAQQGRVARRRTTGGERLAATFTAGSPSTSRTSAIAAPSPVSRCCTRSARSRSIDRASPRAARPSISRACTTRCSTGASCSTSCTRTQSVRRRPAAIRR